MDERVGDRTSPREFRAGGWILAATAVVYGISQVPLWRANLGWDESIYFSQVSGVTAPAFFSAPRARGVTWLAEPLALFTSSPHALRIYLTVLSATAFYLAYRIWFRVLPADAVIISAVLFGGLWIPRLYGAELMPNLWVAFGVVLAVGAFLRLAADARDRVAWAALPAGLAEAALMRPSDAAWVALALLAALAAVPAWRRMSLGLVVLAGAVVGTVPWVVEAYQRFGGVRRRLALSSQTEGGLGLHPLYLLQHWTTLDGPLLCRPCTWSYTPPLPTLWVLVVPLALVVALRASRSGVPPAETRPAAAFPAVALPAAVGLVIAVPYLLLINYSAPRFLLPAFALLALPCGVAARHLALNRMRWLSDRIRAGPAALVVLVIAAQLAVQQHVLTVRAASADQTGQWYSEVAGQLAADGVHPSCVIAGYQSAPVAYYARCSSRMVEGHDTSISVGGLLALARTMPAAVIVVGVTPPAYARHWVRRRLTGAADDGRNWSVYIRLPS